MSETISNETDQGIRKIPKVASWMATLDQAMNFLTHSTFTTSEVKDMCDLLIDVVGEIYEVFSLNQLGFRIHDVQVEFIRAIIVVTRLLLTMIAENDTDYTIDLSDIKFYLLSEIKCRTILQGFSHRFALPHSKYELIRECLDLQGSIPDSVILDDHLVFDIPNLFDERNPFLNRMEFFDDDCFDEVDLTDIIDQEKELIKIAFTTSDIYSNKMQRDNDLEAVNDECTPTYSKNLVVNDSSAMRSVNLHKRHQDLHFDGWLVLSSVTITSTETNSIEKLLPKRFYVRLYTDGTLKCFSDNNSKVPCLVFGFEKGSNIEPVLSPGSLCQLKISGAYALPSPSESIRLSFAQTLESIRRVALMLQVDEKSGGNFMDGFKWIEKVQDIFAVVAERFEVQEKVRNSWDVNKQWENAAFLSVKSYFEEGTCDNLVNWILPLTIS